MTTANMLALILGANACTAWRYSATEKRWQGIPIKGDASYPYSSHNRANTLDELLEEVAASLNDNSLQQSMLHILFNATVADLLVKAGDTFRKHKIAHWQLLDLGYWQDRLALQGGQIPENRTTEWQGNHLLPLLVNVVPVAAPKTEKPKGEPAEKPKEKEDAVARLQGLERENERLIGLNRQYMEQIRAQNVALEGKTLVNPSQRRETLVAFLPVLFKDFWSKVTPATVASLLHTGPQHLPEVPSPFPNPDMATVLAKKKQFGLLPPGEQHSIWQFCTLLDYHHLTFHAEFKPLFEAWLAQNELT